MSQHDTLTQALQEIADWNSHTTEFAVDYGSNGVRDFYRCIARAALSDTQPAQAAQGEPVQPFLVRDVAEMLGVDVPHVCKSLVALGFAQKSTNMEITHDEAVAVAKAHRDAVAQGAGEVVGCTHFTDEQISRALNGAGLWLYAAQGGTPLYRAPQPAPVVPEVDRIRAMGWSVAVHNDYRIGGIAHTFWLFTKDGRAVKGEGQTDADALEQVLAQIAATPTPPAQAAADARDAERYRWLRDEAWAGYNQGKGLPHVFTVDGAGNRRTMLAEEALDTAIDAALATHQQRQDGGSAATPG